MEGAELSKKDKSSCQGTPGSKRFSKSNEFHQQELLRVLSHKAKAMRRHGMLQ